MVLKVQKTKVAVTEKYHSTVRIGEDRLEGKKNKQKTTMIGRFKTALCLI